MLFFTRKSMGTLAAALSRWCTIVQQRKAKARSCHLFFMPSILAHPLYSWLQGTLDN